MNLPTGVGKMFSRNVKAFDARRELEDLSANNFSGYVIESSLGAFGIEEAALFFRSGQAIGSVYEYYGFKLTLSGDEALPPVFNAFASDHGIVDVVELSNQQSDLVTAFNSKLKLSKPLTHGQFRAQVKDTFDATLVQKVAKVQRPEEAATKESLFKRFGLAGIDGHV